MTFKDQFFSTPDAVARRPFDSTPDAVACRPFISALDGVVRRTYITARDLVVERTVELAEIPAPTGLEAARHERARTWWLEDGWPDVHADEVGNLWARVRPGKGPAAVICAHLDTVFDDTVDHHVRRDGTLLRGPGVGDNSVGVAALSTVGALLAGAPGTAPVWIVATVGEEGLGNGAREGGGA